MGEIILDPHRHEHFYTKWKNKGMLLNGLCEKYSLILVEYLQDMEVGRNVAPVSKRGSRSCGRLRNIKSKMQSLLLLLQEFTKNKNISELTEDDVLYFFKDIRDGKIKSPRMNRPYKSTGTYVKMFKAFWHWYMRSQKKKGKELQDITSDLDAKEEKPKFNYFTIDDLKRLCDNSKYNYKIAMMFLFDSGIRAPTEFVNVKVSDLEWKEKEHHYTLQIREETSKTFGRKIKLLLCSEMLKEYIKQQKLKIDDYVFKLNPKVFNDYLRLKGYQILGIGKPKYRDGKKEIAWICDALTMYDFRHASCCHWLPRYKSESSLKYRFGWKKSEMIYYYSEYLGMKDNISQEDLYVDITKTELEKEIGSLKSELALFKDQFAENQKKFLEETIKTQQFYEELKSNKKLMKRFEKEFQGVLSKNNKARM